VLADKQFAAVAIDERSEEYYAGQLIDALSVAT
jgi:hypothetical protein